MTTGSKPYFHLLFDPEVDLRHHHHHDSTDVCLPFDSSIDEQDQTKKVQGRPVTRWTPHSCLGNSNTPSKDTSSRHVGRPHSGFAVRLVLPRWDSLPPDTHSHTHRPTELDRVLFFLPPPIIRGRPATSKELGLLRERDFIPCSYFRPAFSRDRGVP